MNNLFPQLWEYMKSESSYNYIIYYKEDRFKVSSTAEDNVLVSIIVSFAKGCTYFQERSFTRPSESATGHFPDTDKTEPTCFI
jgi:hypothetical protein